MRVRIRITIVESSMYRCTKIIWIIKITREFNSTYFTPTTGLKLFLVIYNFYVSKFVHVFFLIHKT